MKANISLRVSLYLWNDPRRRKELLRMLRQYRGVIDEVAIFTSVTHPALPLAVVRQRAAAIGEVLPEFARLGVRYGINHLSTIGHLDENLANSLNEPWQHMVDISGKESAGCYCAADPAMRQYIRQSYGAIAQARPQFIWVDDDVRLESHPPSLRYGCFCPRCLEAFSAQTRRTWTRESLHAAFASGTVADRLALRRAWLGHARQYIADIFGLVRSAVDEVNPAIELGFMDCEIPYSGEGHVAWAAALAGRGGKPVKWRPGGGNYTDHIPVAALAKAHSIGHLAALLPDSVVDIQSEHENFPYQMLAKSEAVFAAEIGAAIAAGCTGTALNMMGIVPDPIAEYSPRFAAVRKRRRFFDRLVAAFGRRGATGIWAASTTDRFAFRALGGDWPGDGGLSGVHYMRELSEIGLPLAYSRPGATVTVLAGHAPREFSRGDLTDMLRGGVLLDGEALAVLSEIGLGELAGFSIAGR